jgi:tRNA threonylcarbamoyladenosine biosynthesis protein TsaB
LGRNILAIDTSTLTAALAVARADGAEFLAETDPALKHGRSLVPAIQALLREASLALRELDALAVGQGPGSYTGLRIGLTVVKTLAYTLGKPLYALDSLEAVARNAPPQAHRVAVVADAQRETLYTADFAREEQDSALVRQTPTQIEPARQWLERLQPGTLVLGPDMEKLLRTMTLPASVVMADAALGRPRGHALLVLARETIERGEAADVLFLEPLYLRGSAAEEKQKASEGSLVTGSSPRPPGS